MHLLFFIRKNNRACDITRRKIIEAMEITNLHIRVNEVDFDEQKKEVEKYRIIGIPTLLLIKAGKIIKIYSGILEREDIIKIIKENLN